MSDDQTTDRTGEQSPHAMQERLSADPGLADWRVLLGRLVSRWRTGSFSVGAELASRIAAAADELDHHPDVDLRYPHVTVTTVSHDVGRLTDRDRRLALEVTRIAADMGVPSAPPAALAELEVGLDVMVQAAVEPFWRAVLGYGEGDGHADGELVDPSGRLPTLWFQQMDEPRTQRNRFHLDLVVPHDVAQERLARAVEAGGRLVSDEHAPAWWVLADAEGNEVCICTWQGRAAGGGQSQDG